jgi:uncharacterized protein
MTFFPISGVETYWWLPILVAFGISCLTSMGGISGAFVILPFQMSVLGFTSPAVSPTNLLFNIVAIPGGVYRYHREKRMIWSLTWLIIIGTLPGLLLGILIRISYLPDPKAFKFFAGLVLLYIGGKLCLDTLMPKHKNASVNMNDYEKDQSRYAVIPLKFSLKRIGFSFDKKDYFVSVPVIFSLSLIVGIIGGIYGIGGGAFIAPFLVSVFGLPVYTIAGAVLMSTFLTSVFGVLFYTIIAPFYAHTGLAISPDWILGLMFGIGGLIGMYVGARIQKYMPEKVIKAILTICILAIALKYTLGFFL